MVTRRYNQYRPRVILVNFIFTGLLLTILVKLFTIQISDHRHYSQRALQQGTELQILPAIRGIITDRHGAALTSNVVRYSFAADPQVLTDSLKLASALAEIFRRSPADYLRKMRTDRSFVWLERDVPREASAGLLDLSITGFLIRPTVHRQYPFGHITGPLLGMTDVDNRGIAGMELEYDSYLRGEPGTKVLRRNAKGRRLPRPDDILRPFKRGAEIQLTIDLNYQSIFQEEMALAAERLSASSINGVIIDPHTGEILALAQHPSFDANAPRNAPQASQRPMAITDMYEPGSTLKVVSAIAALEEGRFAPGDSIDCEGGQYDYYHLQIKDTYPKGMLSLSEVLTYSSNIGIIKIAEALGPRILYRYGCNLGLGALTGIGLPGEVAGVLRDPDQWSAISTGEIAMGHEVGVTTLQLAMIYSAIANGGLLLEPILVLRVAAVGREDRFKGPRIIRRVASTRTMASLLKMLQGVVENGTGQSARLPGYTLAGKTGTAQKFVDGKYSDTEFVSTFAAIFPARDPRLVCIVAVDQPAYGTHFGSQAAAPIVRNTLRRILNLDDDLYIPVPDEQELASEPAPVPLLLATAAIDLVPAKQDRQVPDFQGYSLRAALKMARRSGVDLRVTGSGRVTGQSLKPGTAIRGRTTVLLTLAKEEMGW